MGLDSDISQDERIQYLKQLKDPKTEFEAKEAKLKTPVKETKQSEAIPSPQKAPSPKNQSEDVQNVFKYFEVIKAYNALGGHQIKHNEVLHANDTQTLQLDLDGSGYIDLTSMNELKGAIKKINEMEQEAKEKQRKDKEYAELKKKIEQVTPEELDAFAPSMKWKKQSNGRWIDDYSNPQGKSDMVVYLLTYHDRHGTP